VKTALQKSAVAMSVPFFDYGALFAQQETELMAVIHDVLRRGHYIMGPDLEEFEQALADYLGVAHAIGMGDGTMALVAGLAGSGLQPGDEVLVPSHTFVATAAAVHHAGGNPILVDCGADHLMEPTSLERAITERSRVIMPVQLNGRTANMDAILAIAERHGLEIVEDSCQALGSRFRGQFAGTFGIAGTFSFYPSKTLGCFGDGGALVTNDPDMAEFVRMFRDHGRGSDGKSHLFGFNTRLDNVQAAVLLHKFKDYDESIARRRDIAAVYDSRLRDIEQLLLPPAPDSDNDHFDIFQNYEIEAERRDELREYLDQHRVKTILQWGGHTIHQFEKLGLTADLPYTEQMTKRFLMLPLHPNLTDEQVHYVCDLIERFYG